MSKYIIFGSGDYGRNIGNMLGMEEVEFFLDNDILKDGLEIEGIPIKYFGTYKKNIGDFPIIIAVSEKKENDIEKQLIENGFENYYKYKDFINIIAQKKILVHPDYRVIYKKSVEWIIKNTLNGEGIITNSLKKVAYPEVTGYYIPTLLRWGYKELATQYAEWLCGIQKQDGSWCDSSNKYPYIFDSGQILKGLIAIRNMKPDVDTNIIKGCDWILSQMQSDGRLVTPDTSAWGSDKNTCDEVIHIYCLSPIIEAGKILKRQDYIKKSMKIFSYYKKNYYQKIMNFSLLSHFYAYLMEALFDLGEIEMVNEAMERMSHYQKKSGAVPAYNDCDWVCSTGVFQLALVWFKLGNVQRGNKAFEYACKLQNHSGGWNGSYISEDNPNEINTYFPDREISWANKYFLDALYYKQKLIKNNNEKIDLFSEKIK